MATVRLTDALRVEYERLFRTIEYTRPVDALTGMTSLALENERAYRSAATAVGMPWHLVWVLHLMESGADFARHLHNGDPLTARTKHVPAGRPARGTPPFTWEESAIDALRMFKYAEGDSVAAALYYLERWNGWGYRLHHPETLSPYLWAGSRHYKSGKYGADGVYSPTLVSKQWGAACILRRFFEVHPSEQPEWVTLRVRLATDGWYFGESGPKVHALQEAINKTGVALVKVDGEAGRLTSDAFRKLTGHFLPGDPRGA